MCGWVEAIAAGRDEGHHTAAVARAADTLRLEGTRLPIEPPAAAAPLAAAVAPPDERTEASTVRVAAAPAPDEEATQAWTRTASNSDATVSHSRPAAEPTEGVLEGWQAPPLDGGTIVLPGASDEPPAPIDPDFELALPDLEDDTPLPAPVQALTDRLPELPSAADLDLGVHEPQMPAARADEPVFELDLGDFNEAPAAGADAAPAAPDAPAEALAPAIDFDDLDLPLDAAVSGDSGVQALEVDMADLDIDFGDAVAAPWAAT